MPVNAPERVIRCAPALRVTGAAPPTEGRRAAPLYAVFVTHENQKEVQMGNDRPKSPARDVINLLEAIEGYVGARIALAVDPGAQSTFDAYVSKRSLLLTSLDTALRPF